MLIMDVAHNLFQNIFQRDQALKFAILVHDQGEVAALLQEGVELVLDRGRLRHEPGLAQDRVEIE